MEYFDAEANQKYILYVIELTYGMDQLVYNELKKYFMFSYYDDGSIRKRYRMGDDIGASYFKISLFNFNWIMICKYPIYCEKLNVIQSKTTLVHLYLHLSI